MPRVDTESFYRHALARYGDNAEGVHWQSEASQQIRFQVLRDLLPSDLSRLSIVDVGCGLGDLYHYLEAHGERPHRYIGIDAVEAMVERARSRTGRKILQRDVLRDRLPMADWYLASGTMALLTPDETRRFIARCLSHARAGLVCNLLKGQDCSTTFNYQLPSAIESWAAELGVAVTIVEGYLHGDFSAALTHHATS
jgi:SAM-dependent methyltransferase